MAEKKSEQLQHRRQDSKLQLKDWKLNNDTFTGRGGYKTGDYLWNSPRESDDYYLARKKNCTYLNLMRGAVNKFVGWTHPDNRPPIVEGAPKGFEEWLVSSKFYDKTPSLIRSALIFGLSHMAMDFSSEENSEPYTVVYKPETLLDWNEKRNDGGGFTGKYTQVKFRIMGIQSDVLKAESVEYNRYYIWAADEDGGGTAETWTITKEKGEESGEPVEGVKEPWKHELSPVITLNFMLGGDEEDAVPVFDSLVKLSIQIFNLMSEQNAYYQKALLHPILVLPESPGTGALGEEDEEEPELELSEDNVLSTDAAGTVQPVMLYGDAGPIREYREDIKEYIERAAYASGLRGPAAYIHPKSGEAYKQEMLDTRAILSDMKKELEAFMINVMEIYAMITEDSSFDPSKARVTWDVASPDLAEITLDNIIEIGNTMFPGESPTLQLELAVKLARILTGNDPEIVGKIKKEVEERQSSDSSNFPQRGEGTGSEIDDDLEDDDESEESDAE